MLILFTPWRKASDLLREGKSWSHRVATTLFSDKMTSVINNINVENECKDAKDAYNKKQKEGANISLLVDGFTVGSSSDVCSLGVAIVNDVSLDC